MDKITFAILSIVFVCIRIRYHQPKRDNATEIQTKREIFLASQFTICLLFSHIAWLVGDSLDVATVPFPTAVPIFGTSLMVGGLILLGMVHRALGSNFSARLEIQQEHTLIRHGPYQYVRHPMYTSGFLYLLGAGLLSGNWLVLSVPVISFSLLVFLRIADEEKMLEQHFGEEWKHYQQHTGKLLPRFSA